MPGSVIISSARTPIGKLSGALASFSAMDLGGFAITAALERGGVGPEQVDYVIMGQVLQGGQGQITARQAAAKAGVPMTVPALTVNKVCLSGMNAIYLADQMVQAGDAEVVVAGGMESMTAAPYLLPGARAGYRMGDGKLVDAMILDGLWCAFDAVHMGAGTENYTGQVGGITLYEAMSVLFIAQAAGYDLNLGQQVGVLLMALEDLEALLEQRLQLGREEQDVSHAGVVERLDAHAVASQHRARNPVQRRAFVDDVRRVVLEAMLELRPQLLVVQNAAQLAGQRVRHPERLVEGSGAAAGSDRIGAGRQVQNGHPHSRRLLPRRFREDRGGEHHQVALAHSLVRRTNALLIDEPLTALDADQRAASIREMLTVQKGYGVTMLLATNDPVVALTLAPHAAVLHHGRMLQSGPLEEVREREGLHGELAPRGEREEGLSHVAEHDLEAHAPRTEEDPGAEDRVLEAALHERVLHGPAAAEVRALRVRRRAEARHVDHARPRAAPLRRASAHNARRWRAGRRSSRAWRGLR